jgi:hypothetical protein
MIAKKGIPFLVSLYLGLCQGLTFAGFQLGQYMWLSSQTQPR